MDDDRFINGFPFYFSGYHGQEFFKLEPNPLSLFRLADLREADLHETKDGFADELFIPDLIIGDSLVQHDLEGVDSDAASFSTASVALDGRDIENAIDVWTLDLGSETDQKLPKLSTWEAFEKKAVPSTEQTGYLSEAGPEAFDAALASIASSDATSGVLPQDVALGALFNLVLGRSSVFFKWNAVKKNFDQVLNDVPISGHSLLSQQSFISSMIDCGSTYRKLSENASVALPSRRTCTAIVALKRCVLGLLESIERHITAQRTHVRSLLQLQALVDQPQQLSTIVSRLVDSVDGLTTDEAVISSLSDAVHRVVGTGNAFGETLLEILSRVSAPWLERLSTDLGLQRHHMGQATHELDIEPEQPVDELSGSFAERSHHAIDLPEFVSSRDRTLIQDTKKSIRLLRRYLPSTVLPSQQANHDLRTFSSASFQAVYPTLDASLSRGLGKVASPQLRQFSHERESLFWTGETAQQDYLANLDARMSEVIAPAHQDRLQTSAEAAFEHKSDKATISLTLASEFDPMEQLRPLVQAQAMRVNKLLLRYLFSDCKLRQHLDLQFQFQLLGNGDFVSRLTTALFRTDAQSAERRRGIIPTAETMGLRLGVRDEKRWPPASSEIQLTLMGILGETYQSRFTTGRRLPTTKDLPGGLSFSIRELPESEIEKVMDSDSIFALDFLKLQYRPPPLLDAILTPIAMQAYDDAFRFLLKMLRALHVTTKLREMYAIDKLAVPRPTPSSKSKCAFEMHHIMIVVLSHFMDVGISAPWNELAFSLDNVERRLDSDDNKQSEFLSLDGLRQIHETCLEIIRTRLFLRRKQQKLRDCVENILTAILQCAATIESTESNDLVATFDNFQSALRELLSHLRAAVGKALNSSKVNDASENDFQATRILLSRLDWNDFYGGTNN